MRTQSSPHPQRGFSLLESLIAVLLISLALLGLVSLQARTVQLSTESEDVQRASLLATELAATMWSLNTLAPAAEITDWQKRVSNPQGSGLPNGEGAVTPNPDGTARISVTWASPRTPGASSTYVTDVMLPAP